MPSIFCSTHGPRLVLVVVPALIVCHGQANLMFGRCALTPIRCSADDRARSTSHATARRKIRPATTRTAVHLTHSGMRRRCGTNSVPMPLGFPRLGLLAAVRSPGGRGLGWLGRQGIEPPPTVP